MNDGVGQSGRRGFTLVEMPFDRSTTLAAACREPPSRAMSASNRELRVVRQMRRRVVRKWKGGAFTLIELLVVIALVGMLAAMLSAALVTARRASIRLECQSKLNQIGQIVQQLSLDNAGIYPMLEQKPVDGAYPILGPPIVAPQAGGTPWWERVYQQTQGAAFDLAAPGVQLPATMQMFHCRMAPALDIGYLDETLSYGLNFDVKRADGTAYQCAAGSTSLEIGPVSQADKDPDQFIYTKIVQPAEFILISEGNAGELDTGERTGSRIAARKVSDAGASNDLHPASVIGRHGNQANVLFADQHVEVKTAHEADALKPDARNVNEDTRLWTLPAD